VCQGDFPQAIPFLARSLELCQVWHIRQNMLSSALALGHALALAGQVSAALALLEQHIEPAALTRQMGRVALSAARVSDIYTPPHTAPGRADRCFDYPRWDNTFPKIGSGTFFKRRLDMACLLSVPFLTLLRIRISQRGNGNDACRGLNPQGMRNGFSPHMG
jgi:hypothetical protein